MKTSYLSFGIALFALVNIAHSQEFVVAPAQSQSQMQASNPPTCQENCNELQAGSAQSGLQIDRGGVDKASVHLQILQQASQKFVEPATSKKPSSDDKKSNVKS